jgi:polar amino acid transport system substrate-binding protein
MKKILAFAFSVMLCMALLTACGSSDTSSEGSETSTDAAAVTTVTPGTLIMATNAYFPPYEFYEGSDIVGIDAEIAQAIADKLGLTLQIQDMEFDSIITAVQTGKADMGLAGMTVTEDRLKNINFSDSYATGIQSIVVPEDSDIASVDDLKGKKIGVQLSTTGDIYACGDFGEENVEKYNKGNDAILALSQGKIDAVIIDNQPAKSYVAATKGLKILDTEYVEEQYAACISKDNESLLTAVNGALKELREDGTLQAIMDKYISAE